VAIAEVGDTRNDGTEKCRTGKWANQQDWQF